MGALLFVVMMSKKLLSLLLPTALFSGLSYADAFSKTDIANDPYWLQLGHYRPAVTSEWKSEVDSPEFFLSPIGKRNPAAELNATLDAFNQTDPTQFQTVACQYPARFKWLKRKLGTNWEEPSCPEMEQWKRIIDPKGMTLVFPTAFMNSPSSMFGHTLIRIDAKDQTRNKELVAFAVNFAAEPDNTDNAALFAIKGLIGQYPGAFSLMPYYRKVREYNDLESRDIWEYKLNFSEQEVENILLHLWELQHARFDYYFLDENCSYQLLALLQLAKEDLDLTGEFPLQAIPSDTVAVLRDKGLLDEPNYRAAFGTKLLHYSEQMDDHNLAAVKEAMKGNYPSGDHYSLQEQAAILEMAYEWLNFKFYDEGLDRDITAPQLTELLLERSKLQVRSPFEPVIKPEVSPEQGHGSTRFGVAYSHSQESDNTLNLTWRASYHDLLDAPQGFIPGAQISFLDTELSVTEHGTTRLERLYLLDAMSLASDNRVFDSWSWNIRSGYDRQPDSDRRSSRWFIQGGYGKSWGNPNKLHGYMLGSTELNTGDIAHNDIEMGLGLETGVVWQATSNNKLAIAASGAYLLDSDVDHHSKITASWQWSPNSQWSLRSETGYLNWRNEDIYSKLTGYLYY